ncbi:hypothetical protein BDN67DRAFT_864221, partial [Paxillus ammoniavirescens]
TVNRLVLKDGPEGNVLCIPSVLDKGRNVHELVLSQAHSILAHLGTWKTLEYLRTQVWW